MDAITRFRQSAEVVTPRRCGASYRAWTAASELANGSEPPRSTMRSWALAGPGGSHGGLGLLPDGVHRRPAARCSCVDLSSFAAVDAGIVEPSVSSTGLVAPTEDASAGRSFADTTTYAGYQPWTAFAGIVRRRLGREAPDAEAQLPELGPDAVARRSWTPRCRRWRASACRAGRWRSRTISSRTSGSSRRSARTGSARRGHRDRRRRGRGVVGADQGDVVRHGQPESVPLVHGRVDAVHVVGARDGGGGGHRVARVDTDGRPGQGPHAPDAGVTEHDADRVVSGSGGAARHRLHVVGRGEHEPPAVR